MRKHPPHENRGKDEEARGQDADLVVPGARVDERRPKAALQHEGRDAIEPEILEGGRQDGRQKLEEYGQEGNRVHVGDAQLIWVGDARDEPYGECPWRLAEVDPAEVVLRQVAAVADEPAVVADVERKQTVEEEEGGRSDEEASAEDLPTREDGDACGETLHACSQGTDAC